MVHKYSQGEKRCTNCNYWITTDALYCKFCSLRLRSNPRYSPIAPSIVARKK